MPIYSETYPQRCLCAHTHISTHPYPSRQNTNRISLFLISSNQGSLGLSYLSLPLERRSPESCYTRNILGPLHFALHLRGRMLKRRSFIHLCRFLLMLQSLAVPCSPLPFPILTHPAFLLILPKVVSATFSGSALPALSPALALAASHPGPTASHLASGPTVPPPPPFHLPTGHSFSASPSICILETISGFWVQIRIYLKRRGGSNPLNSLQSIPPRAVPEMIFKCKCEGSDFISFAGIYIPRAKNSARHIAFSA